MHKWTAGEKLKLKPGSVIPKLSPLSKSEQNKLEAIQKQKLLIARKAANLLSHIPTILFVGVTGSLAMENAKKTSDIDFMIITSAHSLWITRAISLLILFLSGFSLRHAGVSEEEDKLCLNLWIDTNVLDWSQSRNAYIAHEIAQVIPLVNKGKTYDLWIKKNKWIFEYWPYALPFPRVGSVIYQRNIFLHQILLLLNIGMFYLQLLYMNKKRTREIVNLHEAYFHPYDWGEKIMKKLTKKGVIEVQ